MSEIIDWTREVQALKRQITNIEQAAGQGVVPSEAIADLRGAVDHCRTALWGAAMASTNPEYSSAAAILNARLTRVQEMCDRIVEEVVAGRVCVGTPGLSRFLVTLTATEQYVRAILEESASIRSG